ncbi:menaquinone biosynthetic enzyme MqnA/MqnD family protein [Desulfurispira natronophila]|uniref:Chorismate dehydratase n=1 Tax=Desulfurispira natronophila TaxID=682562 RepID=A0A7W7Y2Y3_9BACT|nr:menaquinone biosynthesis protein [Desulfurispira natronophila]MBB5021111.1 chorismate dehydratase [Desulfurispira natronophila]
MVKPVPEAGVVSYINTIPMIYGIEQKQIPCPWKFHYTTPSAISNLLLSAQVQAGLVSSFSYTTASDDFLILPDISIASQGTVQSVLLFHNTPLPRIQQMHLSTSSLTSCNLMKLLMCLEGAQCQYLDIDGEELLPDNRAVEAVMYIGDRALQELRLGRFSYVSDLAALWYDKFHLPFVFALWIVRRDFARNSPELVQELQSSLHLSISYGQLHRETIARQCAQRIGYSQEESLQYLSCINYRLDSEHIKALKLFYYLLEIYQIIPRAPQLDFFQAE